MRGSVWIARRQTWVPIPVAKKEGLLKKASIRKVYNKGKKRLF